MKGSGGTLRHPCRPGFNLVLHGADTYTLFALNVSHAYTPICFAFPRCERVGHTFFTDSR